MTSIRQRVKAPLPTSLLWNMIPWRSLGDTQLIKHSSRKQFSYGHWIFRETIQTQTNKPGIKFRGHRDEYLFSGIFFLALVKIRPDS